MTDRQLPGITPGRRGATGMTGLMLALAPAWSQAQEAATTGYVYPHMMAWGGWYGMIFGPLLMILSLAAAIAIGVLLVRWLAGPGHSTQHPPPGRTPLDILKERYARGEIDKEEFEERRRVLND